MSDSLGKWLEELGLGRYATAFAEQQIDHDVLPELTDEHLKELGLSLGDRLREADLENAVFAATNLQNAHFGEANLRGAYFGGAELKGASFREANLYAADFRSSVARDVDFRDANLLEAIFLQAELQSTYFRGANLQKANLREANLQDSVLYSANLAGADVRGVNFQNALLVNATLAETIFGLSTEPPYLPTDLRDTNLEQAFGLTQEQLDGACGNETTRLPEGLTIQECPEVGSSTN